VLIETLRHIMAQEPAASEILVLDQTIQHGESIAETLSIWDREGKIRWLRLPFVSVTKAMNRALLEAHYDKILFLDDDVLPAPGLIAGHLSALGRRWAGLVAGRVIQPWEECKAASQDGNFYFAQTSSAWVGEFIGCNFSVWRDLARELGGFDENFVRVGYRFEKEFAYRLERAHHRIYFEPTACVHHLKAASGGTRTFGDHLQSVRPNHSVGAYYCQLRTWSGWPSLVAFLSRLPRSVANRHHLRQPWWIPATVIAELSGIIWALFLAIRGPRYLSKRQTLERKCQ
jgi:hypothetical protein